MVSASFIWAAGAGTGAAAAYAASLGHGAPAASAAGLILALLAAAPRPAGLHPAAAAGGAAASLGAAAWLFAAGYGWSLALGLAAAWAAARRLRGDAPAEPCASAWDAAIRSGLLAGAALSWALCLSLFLAHSVYGFAAAAAAVLAGAALSRPLPPGAGALGAAAAGWAGLAFLAFLGLNASQPERLFRVLGSRSDLLFLWLQSALAPAVVAWGLSSEAAGSRSPAGARLGGALAGAALVLAAADRLGTAAAVLLVHAGLALYGAARARASVDLRRAPAQAAAAALVAAAALGWWARGLFPDIWRTRLVAAYPGGDFVFLDQRAGRAEAVYEFSTRQRVRLSGGLAHGADEKAARRLVQLALLGRSDRGGALLLLGAAHPGTLAAVAGYQMAPSLRWVDRTPRAEAALRSLAGGDWTPPAGVVGPLARAPRGEAFDTILLVLSPDLESPERAALYTRQNLAALRGRLAPEGVLALALPQVARPRARARVLRTVAQTFPFAGLLEAPEAAVILASERPFDPLPAGKFERYREATLAKDLDWADEMEGYRWTVLPAGGGPAESAWRSLNALPAADILRGAF